MTEERIEHHVFRFVEKELYNYSLNKKLVENWEAERQSIIEETGGKENIVVDDKKVSNPTLTKTMRLLALEGKVDRAKWYCKAIEDVLEILEETDKRLVELKYFQGFLTNEGVARELNISLRDFYRRRKEIIRRVAVRIGLM